MGAGAPQRTFQVGAPAGIVTDSALPESYIRISESIATMKKPCRHTRVDVIAKDKNGKFLECLDCGDILEAEELEETEPREDLSDA
jgi:hypothetical protein